MIPPGVAMNRMCSSTELVFGMLVTTIPMCLVIKRTKLRFSGTASCSMDRMRRRTVPGSISFQVYLHDRREHRIE